MRGCYLSLSAHRTVGAELEVPSIGILFGYLKSMLFLSESGAKNYSGNSGCWGQALKKNSGPLFGVSNLE